MEIKEQTNNLTVKDYYVIVHSLIAYLPLEKGFWNMEYIKEEKEDNINLDKLRKVINFFSRTKYHKITRIIQEWVNEYKKQTQKSDFIVGLFEENYTTSVEFAEYLYHKILNYNYEL